MCDEGFFLKNNKYCVTECGEGYFKNNKTLTCDICIFGCKVCDKYGRCDVCEDPYNLKKKIDQDECEPKCPEGKTWIGGVCSDCNDPNCKYCRDPTNCDVCKNNLLLQNSRCSKECDPRFYYHNEQKKCVKCDCDFCEKCDKESCITCKADYLLLNYEKKTLCKYMS